MNNKIFSKTGNILIYWGTSLGLYFSAVASAYAQVPDAGRATSPIWEGTFVLTAPYFFVAVIAGLILSIAFELILTNLSAAIGLNVAEERLKPSHRHEEAHEKQEKGPLDKRIIDSLEAANKTVLKVNSWFGLWTIITASISLFFACWISVLISGTFNLMLGALLGLVIWAFFYVILLSLEAKIVSSMVGALTSTAKSALKSAYQSASSIFSKGENKTAESATEIAHAVQKEILGNETLKDLLQQYLNRIEKTFAPSKIRQEIQKVLNPSELDFISKGGIDEERIVSSLISKGNLSQDQAKSAVKSIFEEIKSMKSEGATVVEKATGFTAEEGESLKKKIEQYLKNTRKEELNPEGIKRDLEKFLTDPWTGLSSLKDRISKFDRSTIASLIAQRKDYSKEEAQKLVDNTLRMFNDFLTRLESKIGISDKSGEGVMKQIENKFRDFMNSLGKPELQYDNIKQDLEKLLHDPASAGSSLLSRLKAIDRETLKNMLSQRKDISEEDAEKMINTVLDVRDRISNRLARISDEIQNRIVQIREESLHLAEEASHTAAVASWWSVATAIISAIMAAIGGMMPALRT